MIHLYPGGGGQPQHVSKLGSKKVSKKEVDKTLRREDDKSKSVKPTSLRDENRGIEAEKTGIHKICHPELVSGSINLDEQKALIDSDFRQNDEKKKDNKSLRQEDDKNISAGSTQPGHPEQSEGSKNRGKEPEAQRFSLALISQPLRQNEVKYLTNSLTCSPTHLKTAFTLAEVLLTLGIIGIVAALTVPSLTAKYQEKANIVKLKKFYSVTQTAAQLAINKYGTIDEWDLKITLDDGSGVDSQNLFWSRIYESIRTVKICKYGDMSCSSLINVYSLSGDFLDNYYTRVVFADGSVVYGTYIGSSRCTLNYGSNNYLQNVCGDFGIDINGIKGPNQLGVDYFRFYITKYGIYPIGTQDETGTLFESNCKRKSAVKWNGNGCTAWALFNENLDYLKCDDLSWNGKNHCK